MGFLNWKDSRVWPESCPATGRGFDHFCGAGQGGATRVFLVAGRGVEPPLPWGWGFPGVHPWYSHMQTLSRMCQCMVVFAWLQGRGSFTGIELPSGDLESHVMLFGCRGHNGQKLQCKDLTGEFPERSAGLMDVQDTLGPKRSTAGSWPEWHTGWWPLEATPPSLVVGGQSGHVLLVRDALLDTTWCCLCSTGSFKLLEN